MKNFSKPLLTLLLVALLALGLTACSKDAEASGQSPAASAEGASATENLTIEKTGLWENAVFLADTELGQGSKNIIVEVKADSQSVRFTIHTDEPTVGAALIANKLISGEEGPYGLYIKEVNGITADFDVDQSYWAFYIDGEYAAAGIDSTDIAEGTIYQLEYTK